MLLYVILDNVYIADCSNHRIRKVTISTGTISTISGTGTASFSGDGGAATSATLSSPYGVAVDSSGTQIVFHYLFIVSFCTFLCTVGNVYIADRSNHRIRKVTVATGIISTIAGTGTGSFSGDGGQATSATIKCPNGVAVDSSGWKHF